MRSPHGVTLTLSLRDDDGRMAMEKGGGLQGLDRAAMEKERLARVNGGGGKKRERDEGDGDGGRVVVRQRVLDYPVGAVRMTGASDGRVTIEDILHVDALDVAVVGAYVIMEDWFMSKVDKRRTRVVFGEFEGGWWWRWSRIRAPAGWKWCTHSSFKADAAVSCNVPACRGVQCEFM